MNKVIFLDIDGVLATDNEFFTSMVNFHKKFPVAKELRIPYRFNQKAVKVFNEILNQTDAEIILSSDWKLHWNFEELGQIFDFNNVLKKPFGLTPISPVSMSDLEKNRANEINEFLERHTVVKNHVILDDLDLTKYLTQPDKFVHCKRGNEGLKQSGLKDKVLKILNND